MAPRLPLWVDRLQLEWWRYAIPFAFGPPPKRGTSVGIHSGSCSAVEIGDSRFILTAAHVVVEALKAISEAPTQVIAGPLDLTVDAETASLNKTLDIATIPITSAQIEAIERDGKRVIRPHSWPPPEPKINDGILFAGYPGSWRLVLSWDELDFRATTLLVLVHSVHERYFLCHRDPNYSAPVQVNVQEEVPGMDLAGCSGGPVFLVRNESGELLVPQLCGVVSQDRPVGDHTLLQLARLDALQPSGKINS